MATHIFRIWMERYAGRKRTNFVSQIFMEFYASTTMFDKCLARTRITDV